MGPSGAGKSSLLRVIAGLWCVPPPPHALPPAVTQRLCLPLGPDVPTLRYADTGRSRRAASPAPVVLEAVAPSSSHSGPVRAANATAAPTSRMAANLCFAWCLDPGSEF